MKARYFFAISIVSLVLAVGSLFYYQRTANQLARQVEQVDQVGTAPTEPELQKLQRYVESHIGTSVTVELTGSYQRAGQAAQAATATQSNSQVYAQAQAACGGNRDSVSQSKCISNYINSRTAPAANPQPVVMPQMGDYIKSYQGTSWSLDLTSGALLVSMISAGWGLFTLLHRPRRHTHEQIYRGPPPQPRL